MLPVNTIDVKKIGIAFLGGFLGFIAAGYTTVLDRLFAGDVTGAKIAAGALIVGAIAAGAEAARQKLSTPVTAKLRSLRGLR